MLFLPGDRVYAIFLQTIVFVGISSRFFIVMIFMIIYVQDDNNKCVMITDNLH